LRFFAKRPEEKGKNQQGTSAPNNKQPPNDKEKQTQAMKAYWRTEKTRKEKECPQSASPGLVLLSIRAATPARIKERQEKK